MPRILPGLTLRSLPTELLAGITLLAIAVPLNIGYAQIAGLPATAGLYALILPSILFAVFASTRQLVASPDAAAAALVASSLAGLATAGSASYLQMAMAQAIIGAVMFGLCAVFRLGFLASFLSKPILVGFVGGLALDVLVSQIAKMLGVKIESGADFLTKLGQLVTRVGTTNGLDVAIAALSVAILLVGRHFLPRVPWALIVLITTTILVATTGLVGHGVAVLGKVPAGAPRFDWPQLTLSQWAQLIPSAGALTLVAMAEGLLVARSYGELRGYRTNPNRDLLAFGVANLASGATGGFTVGSSTSRTAAMDQSGSRTQVPSIVAGIGTLLLLIFGTALLTDVPSTAIGAIVSIAVLPLLGIRDFIALWKVRRFEFLIAAVCFLGAIILGPILGIVVAFFLSLLNIARRASSPPVDLLVEGSGPGSELRPAHGSETLTAPGVVVLRFAAPLFFANATRFEDAMKTTGKSAAAEGARNLVLDCEAITDIDVTAAESFATTREWARSAGVTLAYSRVTDDLRAQLAEFDLVEGVAIYPTNRQAIATLRSDR